MIDMHHGQMLFTSQPISALDGHIGYLAGRYRDGAYSDIWTDVARCASRTFTAYAPACSCGWRGACRPVSHTAHISGGRDWAHQHAASMQSSLSAAVTGIGTALKAWAP